MRLPGKLKSSSTTMPSQSNKAGAQRSILDFFGGASGPTDHRVDAFTAPTTEVQCRPHVNSKVLRSAGRQQDKEENEEMNVVGDGSVWQTEIDHLVSMLEGNISERDAEEVVIKVDGDVARAVEMVYNRSGQQAPSLLERTGLVCERTCHELEASSEEPRSAWTSWGEEFEPVKHIVKGSNLQRMQISCLDASVAAPISKYIPAVHACWEKDTPAPYLHLARSFDLIEKESGRLKSTDMLCNMFRSLVALSPSDVLPAVYLTINRISPDFEHREMSIGGSLILRAISEATSTPVAKLKRLYNSLGDLGDVAQACRQTQSTLKLLPILTIHQVFSTLHQISDMSGSGSAARKKNLVFSLLRACRESEAKFIVRTLVQSMRIGATLTTVLTALAHAVLLHGFSCTNLLGELSINDLKRQLQNASAALLGAYNLFPNLDVLVPRLLREGIEALSSIIMCPGTPIRPMLAKIAHGLPEVLKRFQGQAFTCEFKYDGQRAQIHLQEDGSMRIFSRDSDDTTSRFPDIVSIVQDARKPEAVSFILDSEVVAIDRDNGNKLLAFQHLSTRERGGRNGAVIDVSSIKVHICVFIFDIMYANGTALVKHSLRERQKWMHDLLPNIKPGYIEFAHAIEIEGNEDQSVAANRLETFLEEAFSHSCEGFMAKALDEDSEYAASNRSDRWLKVKRDYVEGLHDTLDLVPIGAWHGSGRKAGWYSPFLLACYNPQKDEFESVCRVMSGFSDTFYREAKEFFSGEQVLPKKPPYYRTREKPDVWFAPKVVWEILGADLTLSPVHEAAFGLVHESRGISMRFPRFISVRNDKIPESANSPSDIVDMFHKQTRKLHV